MSVHFNGICDGFIESPSDRDEACEIIIEGIVNLCLLSIYNLLAEEVIFSVLSICLSANLSLCVHSRYVMISGDISIGYGKARLLWMWGATFKTLKSDKGPEGGSEAGRAGRGR